MDNIVVYRMYSCCWHNIYTIVLSSFIYNCFESYKLLGNESVNNTVLKSAGSLYL